MRIVHIHHAKTHLSRLVEAAATAEPFIAPRAGNLVVQVIAVESQQARWVRRAGFLVGTIRVRSDNLLFRKNYFTCRTTMCLAA